MIKEEYLNKFVEDGPEVMVYMMIEQIGGFIWRMSHDMAKGKIPPESYAAIDADIARARPQQIQLVKCITRFDVENPTGEGDHPTENYQKWYRWWSEWHKGMSDDQWNEVNSMISPEMTDEQIAKCRPEGKWSDHDGQYRYVKPE